MSGQHGFRLRSCVRKVEREWLRTFAAGCDAGRPDAVRASRWRGDYLGVVYADFAVLGCEEARSLSKLFCWKLGTRVLRPSPRKRWPGVEKRPRQNGITVTLTTNATGQNMRFRPALF